MLRNHNFFKGFKMPEPLPPAPQVESEEVKTMSDGLTVYRVVRHVVKPEIDNTVTAEDYDLKILLESGVSLKPCPPYSSPSLDELSDLNTHLESEQITEHSNI